MPETRPQPPLARPPTEVMVAFIDGNRQEFGVEPICKVLQVAPSTYYAFKNRVPSARALADQVMIPILVALWTANRKLYVIPHSQNAC